jgi:DNA mismatch repair protein MutL
MDSLRVDVNVHPAKKEVRFKEPRLISTAISNAVRETLRISQTPTVFVSKKIDFKTVLESASISYTPKNTKPAFLPDFENNVRQSEPIERKSQAEYQKSVIKPADSRQTDLSCKIVEDQVPEAPIPKSDIAEGLEMRILAFLDSTYILASSANGLLLVDQHAAHERVLFEKILMASKTAPEVSQKLLIPVSVELSPRDAGFVRKNIQPFEKLGFEIEFFGDCTAIVNSIPESISQNNISGLFSDIVNNLLEQGRDGQKINEISIARAACSHAVKSHDCISLHEAENLIRQLRRCELPFSCPHGRPTIINISYQELEKRFGRRK